MTNAEQNISPKDYFASDDERLEALTTFLARQGESQDEINEASRHNYDECAFEACGAEWLVVSDYEADLRVTCYIKDSLWAFNASFLSGFTGLPEDVFTALQDKCEDANETFLHLIEDCGAGLDNLVQEAVSADGRGHFLSSYDGEEHEHGEFYIYRIN